MATIKITHPSILVDPDADYAEMDIFEGESRIYRGISHTYGKVLDEAWNTLAWYDYKVDSSVTHYKSVIDPKTFNIIWEDCYLLTKRYKRWGQTDWDQTTHYLPIKEWDPTPHHLCDADEVVSHVEALSYLFMFEPNDAITRDNLQCALEFDLDVFQIQGDIYDYSVVCDESINTPDVIDRCQLRVDVALKPSKAAGFIYIPITIGPADDFLNFDITVETDEDRYDHAMKII